MYAVDYAWLVPALVDTLVFTFRVLAGVMSIIAGMLWWKMRHVEERPPYDRRRNDIAWNWGHAGMIVGACSFIALDFEYRAVTGQALADLFVAVVWWCWANAATVRLSARVDRPRFVYLGASVFVIAMPIYALLTGG